VAATTGNTLLLWLLALYGLLALGAMIYGAIWRARQRPAGPPHVSILLVAKNKERNIEGLVRSLAALNYADLQGTSHELVVVDDMSTDQTGAILDRLARYVPLMRTVHMADLRNNGATAVEVGVFMCRSPIVLLLNLEVHTHPRLLVQAVARLLAAGQSDPSEIADLGPGACAITRIRADGVGFQGKERIGRTSN